MSRVSGCQATRGLASAGADSSMAETETQGTLVRFFVKEYWEQRRLPWKPYFMGFYTRAARIGCGGGNGPSENLRGPLFIDWVKGLVRTVRRQWMP